MRQLGLLIISLGMVGFWLVGSYLPSQRPFALLALPFSQSVMGSLAILCFVFFLAIQFWILRSTQVALKAQPRTATDNLQLKIGMELFWTILPIVLTLLLAWYSWIVWHA